MNSVYQRMSISLMGSISLALEQIEERNYGRAEKILREAWDKAMGGGYEPSEDLPTSFLLK